MNLKKYLVLLFPLFGACAADPKLDPVEVDLVSRKMIYECIGDTAPEGIHMIYFIYPDFCGACTDSVMNFIRSESIKGASMHYVLPEGDTSIVLKYPALQPNMVYKSEYELDRHGLFGASNKLFVFLNKDCLFSVALNNITVPAVRKTLDSLRHELEN